LESGSEERLVEQCHQVEVVLARRPSRVAERHSEVSESEASESESVVIPRVVRGDDVVGVDSGRFLVLALG
jgi:hypothetical protein